MEKTFTNASNPPNAPSYAISLDIHDKSQWRDSIPLFILIVIGISGVFYVLQNSSDSISSKNAMAVSYFTSNISPEEQSTVVVAPREKTEKETINKSPVKTNIKIRGVLEAQERLTFKIENYDPDFLYTIDFGNGISRIFNKTRVSYIYPESGTFVIKVMAENLAGIRQNVYKEIISIDKEIRVYDNAHIELTR